ncbi:MAG: T9SS type A sorting domain-containing protein [Candidatus Cloacimonetes bacterium]|nr:T9SS type A sorting domain-containing protein [Candidatus Cloacimonadota bacterium]
MKNKNRLVFLMVFTLLTISLLSYETNRHYALLQKNYSITPMYADFSGGTLYDYDYVEENNNLLLSHICEQLWSEENGVITYYPEALQTLSHVYQSNGSETTLIYTATDSLNNFLYRMGYTYDDQERLTAYYDESNNHLFLQKMYYSSFTVPDSIYYSRHHYGTTNYGKFINTLDSLYRINNEYYYTSSDSIIWEIFSITTIAYNGLLDYSLNFNSPLIMDLSLSRFLYSQDYKVASINRFFPADSHTYTYNYHYNYSDNTLIVSNGGSRSYEFNINGYITRTELNDNFSEIIIRNDYIWGEYTSNEDDYIISTKLSVYPNPFKADLNITIDRKTPIYPDISIYNIKGQLIRSWKDVRTDELTWDGKDESNHSVSSGIYLIKAKQGNQISTAKVIKFQ